MLPRTLEELVLKYSQAKLYTVDNVTIKLEHEGENEFKAYISTPRLELEPTSNEHTGLYSQMASNPDTMKLYGRGNPWSEEYTSKRVASWEQTWKQANPFSGFAVYTREEEFVGHVALDYDETTPQNCAEISYFMKLESWGKGLGGEAVYSVVNPYSEAIRKYKCKGESYEGVYSTARPDNLASLAVLLKAGLELQEKDFTPKQTKWGERVTFFKKLTPVDAPSAITSEASLSNGTAT